MSTARSLNFGTRANNRYWWFRSTEASYIPPIFSFLDEQEWSVMDAWYADTDKNFAAGTGECNIPPISILHGLIAGSNIKRVVQLGHYIGFSTLLLGFLMRRMGHKNCLFSIDIDPIATAYTEKWVESAGLQDQVKLHVSDSADPTSAELALAHLNGMPELVFLDSSHQYDHTIRELDLWFWRIAPGALMALHDTSAFAAQYDVSNKGGVLAALQTWSRRTGVQFFALNESVTGAPGEPPAIYRDGCGLGLIQKPMA